MPTAVANKKNILIVGNQPKLTADWAQHIAIAGFEPVVVHTGAGALLKIEQGGPSLILLDTSLTDRDALEVLRFVRTEPKSWRTPIIAVSALPHMKDRCLQAGADGFLLKPFEILQLIVLVRKLLGAAASEQ